MSEIQKLAYEAIIESLINKTISIIQRAEIDLLIYGQSMIKISDNGIEHIPFDEYNDCQSLINYNNSLWC